MIDIVERLRAREVLGTELDGYIHSLPINPDGDDGADEITRLRSENEQLRQALTAILNDVGYHNPMRMTTEISDKLLFEAKAVLND